jgi:hypothetical protein
MDEVAIAARRERLDKLEKPVSGACGVALAVLYVYWRLEYTHVIATFTWMLAFFVGAAIPKFWFAVQDVKLGRMARELANPPLATARALPSPPSPPSPPIKPQPTVEPPKPEAPVDPASGPRYLS